MSGEKKSFSDMRWNDTGKPKVIGHSERTEEERAADKDRFRSHLKKIGVMNKENED